MDIKSYLTEVLEFYLYKVKTNGCTMEEMNSVLHMLEENMGVNGTVEDFAKFYGQSEQNVRTTISRKMIAKPKRKVFYPFYKFLKIVPDKWREDK